MLRKLRAWERGSPVARILVRSSELWNWFSLKVVRCVNAVHVPLQLRSDVTHDVAFRHPEQQPVMDSAGGSGTQPSSDSFGRVYTSLPQSNARATRRGRRPDAPSVGRALDMFGAQLMPFGSTAPCSSPRWCESEQRRFPRRSVWR